jgi:hypothetical protein
MKRKVRLECFCFAGDIDTGCTQLAADLQVAAEISEG